MKEVKAEFLEEFKKLDSKFLNIINLQKEKINKFIRFKIQEIIIKLMERLRPYIKRKLKDPDMCDFVKRFVDDIVDEIYPELIEELKFKLQ